MSLKQQIDADIKQAMLAKNKDELKALRAIKSMILLAETDKGSSGELSGDAEMKLVQPRRTVLFRGRCEQRLPAARRCKGERRGFGTIEERFWGIASRSSSSSATWLRSGRL